jgi:hypothetical protein
VTLEHDGSHAPPPLDDDERAFRDSFALLVDFYRVEQGSRLVKAFLPAVLGFVPLGGLCVLLALATHHVSPALAPFVTTLGLVLIACGPASAIFLLLRSMHEDLYVAIRVDGLALKLDPRVPEVVLPWDDLRDVCFDAPRGSVVLSTAGGEQYLVQGPFAEVSLATLAARIRDARRLAVWNRLVPRVPR